MLDMLIATKRDMTGGPPQVLMANAYMELEEFKEEVVELLRNDIPYSSLKNFWDDEPPEGSGVDAKDWREHNRRLEQRNKELSARFPDVDGDDRLIWRDIGDNPASVNWVLDVHKPDGTVIPNFVVVENHDVYEDENDDG